MTHPLQLHLTHVHGIALQDTCITYHHDALLDSPEMRAVLDTQAFSWLANARCMVRQQAIASDHVWFIQAGSHHHTCSVNDERIACAVPCMLHPGDHIEIGMLRLCVGDMYAQQAVTPVTPPPVPVIQIAEAPVEVPAIDAALVDMGDTFPHVSAIEAQVLPDNLFDLVQQTTALSPMDDLCRDLLSAPEIPAHMPEPVSAGIPQAGDMDVLMFADIGNATDKQAQDILHLFPETAP